MTQIFCLLQIQRRFISFSRFLKFACAIFASRSISKVSILILSTIYFQKIACKRKEISFRFQFKYLHWPQYTDHKIGRWKVIGPSVSNETFRSFYLCSFHLEYIDLDLIAMPSTFSIFLMGPEPNARLDWCLQFFLLVKRSSLQFWDGFKALVFACTALEVVLFRTILLMRYFIFNFCRTYFLFICYRSKWEEFKLVGYYEFIFRWVNPFS